MDAFDWNLLKRPDRLPPPASDENDSASDSCSTPGDHTSDDEELEDSVLVQPHPRHPFHLDWSHPSVATPSGSSSDPTDGSNSNDGDVAMPDISDPLDLDGSEDGYDGRPSPPLPWLHPDIPEPPMPNAPNTPYSDLLLDPRAACIESDPETFELVLVRCKVCRSALKGNRVPPNAMSNYNFIGPVPPELADLTVVEEAMIALCRAKC
ncbi:hypothetical protein FB451DRAFT_1414888 [Mycena latifolia]|nr:hypothetical protein FB451DRAFT_1414888 [Mycena latifolia]